MPTVIVHLKRLFPTAQDQEEYFKRAEFLNNCRKSLNIYNAVAIWPVTGQGFQNTKWPAVLYSQ